MGIKCVYVLVIAFAFGNPFGVCGENFKYLSDCLYSRLWDRQPGTDYIRFICDKVDNETSIFTKQNEFHCSYHPDNHTEPSYYPGTMTFVNCEFSQFKTNLLAKFPNIHTLHMPNMELEVMQMDIFLDGKNLRYLNASGNRLSEIPESVFWNARNLTIVDFARNLINRVDGFAFEGASKIEQLNLAQNALTTFDEQIFLDLVNLQQLNLSHNALSSFNCSKLPFELTELDLSHNNISIFGQKLKKVSKLNYLSLAHNPIKALKADAFAKLPYLQHLNLKQTQLSSIQLKTISHQHKLISLDLSKNNLTKLDFKLFELIQPDLQSLDLNNNQLNDLAGFDHDLFPQLNLLHISGNNFNCTFLRQFIRAISTELIQIPVEAEPVESGQIQIHGIKCRLH